MTRLALILVTLILGLFWLAAKVRAEPCTRAQPVRVGEAVPCDGDLMPAAGLARLIEEARAHKATRAALALCEESRRIDADEAAGVLAAERDARQACEQSRTPPPCPQAAQSDWWERPAFIIPTTVTATLIVVASVYAATR